ncbi:MAG: winged helix-turn-helix domain-containing protein [Pseudomonadota bacterium]
MTSITLGSTDRSEATPTILDVMVLLARSAGETVRRETFLDQIWSVEFGSDESLTRAISILRKHFTNLNGRKIVIETVPRKGYRLVAEVSEGPVSTSPVKAAAVEQSNHDDLTEPTPQIPVNIDANRSTLTRKETANRLRLSAVVAVLLCVVIVSVLWSLDRGDLNEATDAPSNAIAVLPFNIDTLELDDIWFSDGLVIEIAGSLSELSSLQVTSLRSSARFEGANATLSEIAETLNVSYLVEGSVRKLGDELRMTVSLIRTSDERQIWSESYTSPAHLVDLFDVQTEISNQIIRKLDLSLNLEENISQTYYISDAGYENYLAARALLNKRTPDGMQTAYANFKELIADYPTFSPAYGGLIEASLLTANSQERFQEALIETRRLAQVASQIEPVSSDLLRAIALIDFYEGNSDAALQNLDRALRLDPNDAQSLQRKSIVLSGNNQTEKAAEVLKQAHIRDPLSPIILTNLAQSALIAEDYDLALRYAEQNYEWNKDAHVATLVLSKLYYDLGDYTRAYEIIQEGETRFYPYLMANTAKGEILWRAGFFDQLTEANKTLNWAAIAAHWIESGDRQRAVELAEASGSFWFNRLTHIVIYDWANDQERAYEEAVLQASLFENSPDGAPLRANKTDALAIVRALQRNNDDRVDRFAQALGDYVSNKTLETARSGTEFYAASSWYAYHDDFDTALIWLNAAADKGFIFREIFRDPTYDPYRASKGFQSVAERFETNARGLRDALLEIQR